MKDYIWYEVEIKTEIELSYLDKLAKCTFSIFVFGAEIEIPAICYGLLAEVAYKYLKKGSQIKITGVLNEKKVYQINSIEYINA